MSEPAAEHGCLAVKRLLSKQSSCIEVSSSPFGGTNTKCASHFLYQTPQTEKGSLVVRPKKKGGNNPTKMQ